MGKPFQKDFVSNVAQRTTEFAGEAVKKTGKNFLVNLFKNNKPAVYTIAAVAFGGTAFFLGKHLGKKKGKKEIEAASVKNEANADCKE